MNVRVPPVAAMDDETVMKHLELRHGGDLAMEFLPEPDRTERRMHAPTEWRTYHQQLHSLHVNDYDHLHNEE